MKPSPLKQALWQVPVLIFLSVLLALALNHLRPDGLPLTGSRPETGRPGDGPEQSLEISLEEAQKHFNEKTAFFLDARPLEQYADGHIQGALNLSWQNQDARFMGLVDQLDPAKIFVTYCDGETCELSHDLAVFLRESGFNNTRVLVNGWTLWREAGLPVEIGQ